MSNSIFPVMAGMTWDVVRSPAFNTLTHRSASGREMRAALQSFPLWTFKLKYEILRAGAAYGELQTLAGFFLARQGSFDSFLYSDPTDSNVVAQLFGTADGSTTQFQLVRGWASFIEPVMNIVASPLIYVAGVLKTVTTDYIIDSAGMVTFTTAPSSSAALTWTGSFYYRVRFMADAAEFNQMMKDLWELKTLEFVGSTGNRV